MNNTWGLYHLYFSFPHIVSTGIDAKFIKYRNDVEDSIRAIFPIYHVNYVNSLGMYIVIV